MDAFYYFPNIYCSFHSWCKRYLVSTFARYLKLWWEIFFRGIWANDIFNCTISNFWWYGLPKISNFSKSYGFMPRAINIWTFKNVKVVCSTNTMFVVKFIKFRIKFLLFLNIFCENFIINDVYLHLHFIKNFKFSWK